MRLLNTQIFESLDKYLAIAGIFASLVLISYTLVNFSRILYSLPGILSLLTCITWLIIRGKTSLDFQIEESRSKMRIFGILSLLFLIISILSVRFRPELYERPLLFFMVTSLMAGAIACQIVFSTERYKWLILPQIIILGMTIAWSQLLIFPNVVGADPWYHQMVTQKIIDFGTIPGGSYSHLPLFHLIIAITSLFSDLNYKIATIFSVSSIQIICNALFIYALAVLLLKNYKIGLLAALMVVLGNHHIFMSYWSIPNGFAAVFIPIVLFLIWKNDFKSFLYKTSLILLLFIAIILTHSIASMCMAILLSATWAASATYSYLVLKREQFISVILPVLFTITMFFWWGYASGYLNNLAKLIKWGFSRDYFIMQTTTDVWTKYVQSIPISEQVFNQFGMFLFFALSFIGIFFMVSSNNKKSLIMAFIAIIPLAIGFFSLIGGFSVIEHRWWYFAQILLSIPLGICIGLLFNFSSTNSVKITGLFIFISIFTFVLIMSPAANSDNPIFSKNTSYRSSFSESELFSVESISSKYIGQIGTERYVAGVISFLPIDIDLALIDANIYSGDYSQIVQDNILMREYIKEKTFKLFQTAYRIDYDPDVQLTKQGFSKTYDSKSVAIYSKTNLV